MKLSDLIELNSIDDHPRMHQARKAVADAERQLHEALAQRTAADSELTAAEHAAAIGKRDDRRLKTAREQLSHCDAEVRIATARVENARTGVQRVLHETCIEVEQQLIAAQRPALERLDETLAAAKRASDEVARLEMASTRLFPGGPYRLREGLPGMPLTRLAWWFAFGGPSSNQETRYSYWRQFARLAR